MTRQEKINKVSHYCAANNCISCKAAETCQRVGYGTYFWKWSNAADDVLDAMIAAIDGADKPPKKPPITRASILDAAKKNVCGDRQDDHGTPENSFAAIADGWRDYIKAKYQINVPLVAVDTAAMMAVFKIARVATGHGKSDNWVDLAGYAACGGEIEDRLISKTEAGGK